MKAWLRWPAAGAALMLVLAPLVVAWLNVRGEEPLSDAVPGPAPAAQIQRGAYLAQVGNCMACHTQAGGAPFAGGRAIDTPFGTVYSSNLTPDMQTGLGRWSPDHFWRALHHGRSRDGRLLNPAFPYTEFTRISRQDSDDLYAYLHSLPAQSQAQPPSTLRWPLDTPWALALWRALYFRAADPSPQGPAGQSAEWQRGAYLVNGLGHCGACHTPRDRLGGLRSGEPFRGGLLPARQGYAPALSDPAEAGVMDWPVEDIVALLKTGINGRAVVSGPMAEVVFRSTRFLQEADARAMAVYLKSLPVQAARTLPVPPRWPAQLQLGRQLYEHHCAQCHGEQGQGVPGAYPALAGNRAVAMGQPANLVRIVLDGGYPPATPGHPRPHGMPPLRQQLSDEEVAAVLSYVRDRWGDGAGPVSSLDLLRDRGTDGF
ncbi:MAG: cytochrome c [Curvibacter sp.]|nr:cytochrome c [Curvibacter sp.]